MSLLFKAGLSAASVIGLATLAVMPASAENASVSGAVTKVTPGTYSTSVAGEMVAPTGMYYDGPLVVKGEYNATTGDAETLTITPGTLTPIVAPASTTLKDTVITKLSNITTTGSPSGIDEYTAILKAAAGADGLE